MIQQITADTGAVVEIEDDGTVYITGKTDQANSAKEIIEGICHEYKVGERFEGEVVRLMDFGAFVQIGKDTDGLVHVSEIANFIASVCRSAYIITRPFICRAARPIV